MNHNNQTSWVPHLAFKKVDLRYDNTIDVLEKLSFEATGGKVIIGLWESPMPAAVNPVSKAEADSWDTRPMSIEFSKKHKPTKLYGGKPISVKSSYRIRNKAMNFFGYSSEPPSAPLFHEDVPVGPVATAIKAAGELIALGDANNEDTSAVENLFSNVWDRDLASIRNFITPDLSQSSGKDIIKFERKSNHTLIGFSPYSPSVKIDLAGYRPETMPSTVYIDWHKVALTLRWIGEFNSRYNSKVSDALCDKKQNALFSPILEEMPKDLRIPLLPAITNRKPTTTPNALVKIADMTMKYYEGTIKDLSQLTNLRSRAMFTGVVDEFDINMETIKNLVKFPNVKVSRVPVGPIAYVDVESDIAKVANTPRQGYSNIHKLKFTHHFSGQGAVRTLLEAKLASCLGTKEYREVRTLITSHAEFDKFGNKSILEAKRVISNFIPPGFGDMLFRLLRFTTSNDVEASEKFSQVIHKICPNGLQQIPSTKSGIFMKAIQETNDINWILGKFGSAYRILGDRYQSASGITFRPRAGMNPIDIIGDAMTKFGNRKMKFWEAHYKSRMDMFVGKLKDKNSRKDPDRIVWKKKVILYSTLQHAYTTFNVTFDGNLRVNIKMKPDKWVLYMLKTISNYRRKRMVREEYKHSKSSKAKQLESSSNIELVKTWESSHGKRNMYNNEFFLTNEEAARLMSSRNMHEMFAHADSMIQPQLRFMTLDTEIHRRMKMTQASIGATFRMRLGTEHCPEDVDAGELDDQEVVAELARLTETSEEFVQFSNKCLEKELETAAQKALGAKSYTQIQNPYDALYVESSESDEEGLLNIDENQQTHGATNAIGTGQIGVIEEDVDMLAIFGMTDKVKNYKHTKAEVNLVTVMKEEYGVSTTVEEISDTLNIPFDKVIKYPFSLNGQVYEDLANKLLSKNIANVIDSLEKSDDKQRDIV